MPTSKMTMLFQHSTRVSRASAPVHRTGGWSESWYFNGDIPTTIAVAQGQNVGGVSNPSSILALRARLLPLGSAIVAIRVQSVNPPSSSQTLSVNYPGDVSNKADLPQDALLCTAPGSGVANIRRFILRALPDSQSTEGEFEPTSAYQSALQDFFNGLAIWQLRGRDLSQAVNPIVVISSTGIVTAAVALTYNLLDFVRVLKTRDSTGNLRGGRFQVSAVGPNTNQITLLNWTFGASAGGSLRKDPAPIFALINPASTRASRTVSRRVGRPFFQFRGRRSRRR